eukprot:symbB.v1.2.010570.t1/scaffold691.1/size191848/11
MADRAVSCAPRGREASAPISRPTMPRPASWGPVKAAKTTPRTGRPQPKKEAQPAPAPAPTSKVNSSLGSQMFHRRGSEAPERLVENFFRTGGQFGFCVALMGFLVGP